MLIYPLNFERQVWPHLCQSLFTDASILPLTRIGQTDHSLLRMRAAAEKYTIRQNNRHYRIALFGVAFRVVFT